MTPDPVAEAATCPATASSRSEGVELSVEVQCVFRIGQPMPVSIKLHNATHQTVQVYEKDPERYTHRIEVTLASGTATERLPEPWGRPGHAFPVGEDGHAEQTVDLRELYKLDQPGEYRLSVIGGVTVPPDEHAVILRTPWVKFRIE